MRTLLLITALCVFVVSPALADMTITLQDSVGSGRGGEFTATVTGDPILGHTTTFGTFCVETSETISFGTKYWVTLNTAAVNGGVGGSPDPLSNESAWVYTQWDTYAYAHTQPIADDVQNAIWWFEQEGGSNNLIAQAATAAVVGGWRNSEVMVMNLYGDAYRTQLQQDLLVRVPVPAAVLLGMLGLGAAGVKLRKHA